MIKFDLMKEKPKLDIPTLNFIWDGLWRENACNNRSNKVKEGRHTANVHTMEYLEKLTNDQERQ
jgi:hypothetical protein